MEIMKVMENKLKCFLFFLIDFEWFFDVLNVIL